MAVYPLSTVDYLTYSGSLATQTAHRGFPFAPFLLFSYNPALYYGGYAWGQSGPANNGNLTRQEHYAPADDSLSNYWYTQDSYSYDFLNRLGSTSELHGGPWGQSGQDYIQTFDYDRWGNRTINPSSNISNTQFDKTDAQNTNRLYAPGDTAIQDMNQRRMRYDSAGNQTYDSYSDPGQGARTYDAENRMTGSAGGSPASYSYDADGRRIKRNVNGSETWHLYGMDGELLAEYQSGAAAFLPATEYGYRNGELLTTIQSGDTQRLSRFVTNLYYGAKQRDPNSLELQDGINQLAAAGAQSQPQLLTVASQIARSLFTSTNYETAAPARSDAQYVADLYYAYLQRGPDDGGLNWWAGQAASSRGNVCNGFEASGEFQTLVATLYGTAASDNERTEHFVNNFYLGATGQGATATELQQQRDSLNTAAAQGQAQVQTQAETMGRALFAAQVNDASLSNTQFVINLYEGFLQRGPDDGGLGWWSGQANVGQGRQNVLNAFATCGAFRELAGTLYREANWLVADQLGTPRMIVNKSGSLSGVKRHDYLPFGEEIFAGTGGRTTTPQGYSSDSVRQKFTLKERDNETGLDFFEARYYSSTQGRFTSADPLLASGQPALPQSWNRYAYCVNNPLINVDPSGLWWYLKDGSEQPEWFDKDPGKGYTQMTEFTYWGGEENGYVALDPYSNNWQIGFDSQSEATGYSDKLAAETMQARDPGQYVSQLDGTLEVATYISGVQGVIRIGAAAGERLLAREASTLLTETTTQATIHGGARLAARGFTEADIAITRTGTQLLQRDGATVFLKEVTPGKFNVIVEGGRGVVTALKNISEKSVARLAQNYGWSSAIK